MRFFCDNDVDAAVAKLLKSRGHNAWTADDANLAAASDSALAIYAHDHRAALISHDAEFSRWRKRNIIGWHVYLACHQLEAVALITTHLDDVVRLLEALDDLHLTLSKSGMKMDRGWQ